MTITHHTDGKIYYLEADDSQALPPKTAVTVPEEYKRDIAVTLPAITEWQEMPEGTQPVELEKCQTCGGRGTVLFEIHPCDICNGSGLLYSKVQQRDHYCPACMLDDLAAAAPDGQIAVPVAGGVHVCPDCDGWRYHRSSAGNYALNGLMLNGLYAHRILCGAMAHRFARVVIPRICKHPVLAFASYTALGIAMPVLSANRQTCHAAIGYGPCDKWATPQVLP